MYTTARSPETWSPHTAVVKAYCWECLGAAGMRIKGMGKGKFADVVLKLINPFLWTTFPINVGNGDNFSNDGLKEVHL